MMIRRYIVKDMPEAVVLIRKELGKDAVILNSKRITVKKWLGLWRYKRLEVLAATGDDVPVRVHGVDLSNKTQISSQPGTQSTAAFSASVQQTTPSVQSAMNVSENAISETAATSQLQKDAAGPGTEQVVSAAQPSPLDDVRKQIEDMKKLLESTVVTPGLRPPLVQQLLRQGLSEEHVVRLMETFSHVASQNEVTAGLTEPVAKAKQRELFIQHICEDLNELIHAQPIAPTSRVVALVGPTGVGKTTTIAKLAALHVLAGKRKVGLLTADTFRIAAVEQLKTYANILNVPLEVVYQTSDIRPALDRLADRDLILVDTAGRNFRIDTHVEEVLQLFQHIPVDETYLVLSMTSKSEDLEALAAAFDPVPVDKFLFTKLDETSTFGAILNLLYTHRKPLSYLTVGQNVPDDIEVASIEKILRLILGGAA